MSSGDSIPRVIFRLILMLRLKEAEVLGDWVNGFCFVVRQLKSHASHTAGNMTLVPTSTFVRKLLLSDMSSEILGHLSDDARPNSNSTRFGQQSPPVKCADW